ncbi:MAG: isocitrate lyase/phosphoenolpyruvate mutase family protein [Armatimonadetes bacterium]|nr:isocitrate lyase/phosphoenolpyruvate mutase family protein [Armatimonadota bacterium]
MCSRDNQRQFAELLKRPGVIRSLGAHDVFTALIVEQAGFETVLIGGFGTSASLHGLPDLNFLTMSEMADAVRRMATRVSIPVIADGDTGQVHLRYSGFRTGITIARATPSLMLEFQSERKWSCGNVRSGATIWSESKEAGDGFQGESPAGFGVGGASIYS